MIGLGGSRGVSTAKGSGRLDDGGDVGHRSRFSSFVTAPCSSRRHEIRRSEELAGRCGYSIQRVTSANVGNFPDLRRSIVDHGLPTPSSRSESHPLRPGLCVDTDLREVELKETDKPSEWVEWRETSDSGDPSDILPNGELQTESTDAAKPSPSSADTSVNDDEIAAGPSAPAPEDEADTPSSVPSQAAIEPDDGAPISNPTIADNTTKAVGKEGSCEATTESDKKEKEVEGN